MSITAKMFTVENSSECQVEYAKLTNLENKALEKATIDDHFYIREMTGKSGFKEYKIAFTNHPFWAKIGHRLIHLFTGAEYSYGNDTKKKWAEIRHVTEETVYPSLGMKRVENAAKGSIPPGKKDRGNQAGEGDGSLRFDLFPQQPGEPGQKDKASDWFSQPPREPGQDGVTFSLFPQQPLEPGQKDKASDWFSQPRGEPGQEADVLLEKINKGEAFEFWRLGDNLKAFIENHGEKITTLRLGSSKDNELILFLIKNCPKLTVLCIDRSFDDENDLEAFLSVLPNGLRQLELTGNAVDDDHLRVYLCNRKWTNLKELFLRNEDSHGLRESLIRF